MGLAQAGGEVTEYAKKQATLALLMEGGKVASGALEQSQSRLSSQLERAGAIWTETKTAIGSAVAGPMALALSAVNDLAASTARWLGITSDVGPATISAAQKQQEAMEAARRKADEAAAAQRKAREAELAAAKEKADEAAKSINDRVKSMADSLEGGIGSAVLGSAEAWDLYKLAVDGASAAQLGHLAGLMEQNAQLKAREAIQDRMAEKARELNAWNKEHWGMTGSAEYGSAAAAETIARFTAGNAAVIPQEDPIQRELLKSSLSIEKALNMAVDVLRSQGKPHVYTLR
jgi:hypothetical protein